MFQPVGDKLLIRQLEIPNEGTIALPDGYEQPEQFGEVVRLGTYMLTAKGVRHQNFPVEVGDHVTFAGAADAGKKIEENGEELLLLHVGQLRCVVGGEA